MIVYECPSKWVISSSNRRMRKKRMSDRDKRKHDLINRFRRDWWWYEASWNRRHELNQKM